MKSFILILYALLILVSLETCTNSSLPQEKNLFTPFVSFYCSIQNLPFQNREILIGEIDKLLINENEIFSKEIKGLLKNNLNDIEQNSCSTSECILFIVWVLLQEDEYYEAYNLINQVSYDTLEPISLVYNDLYNEIKRNLFINNQFELSSDEYKSNHDTAEYYYFYLKDLYYKSTQERYSSKIENALSTTYYALFTLSTKIPNKEYEIIISKLLFRLGVLYMEQYEFNIAINCFQKCSELAYNKSTTLKQWYLSELQLAYNNAILNNYSNAIYHLENVDKIKEINPFLKGYTLYIKALVYFRLNEYSEALNLISGVELSSFECSDIDNRIYDFKAYINKAFGNYNHALENSNLALNYLPCDSIRQMSIEQYSFLRTKGSIYFEMKIDSRQSLELALENFMAQKKKVDFVNQEDISHYGNMLASASENVLKTLFHLNQIDPQKKHLNQAFQTLSEAKNRSIKIADRKHRSQYFLNLSQRDQKKLNALNHIIESCLDSCDHFKTIKPFDSEFYKDLYFAYKEKDELLAQYPQEQISLEADRTEMDLKGLQTKLGEHHAQYIDYFFGEEYGIVLSLTSNTCVLDTFDMTLTKTTARKVYNDLIGEDTQDINANHTLASIILNPYIDTSLNKLIVCPDNILNGIPFSALSINQDSSVLLDKMSVSYVTGPQDILDAHVIYDPDIGLMSYSDDYTRNNQLDTIHQELLFSDVECEAIKELATGLSIVYTSGKKVNEKNFSAALKNNVFHFAGHSRSGQASIHDNQFIVRDGKGRSVELAGYSIKQWPSNVELAVLSSCESGIGQYNFGEGTYSLSRQFLLIGTKSVVKSLWKVNDLSTKYLMTSFYSYLFEGYTASESLRLAKLDMFNNSKRPQFKDPFYWSGFVLEGQANIKVKKSTS